NRFSRIHKRNDEGAGVKVASRNFLPFSRDPERDVYRGIVNVQYEFIQQRFRQVERFRSIEFERDWNRPLSGVPLNDQHLANAEIGVMKSDGKGIAYNVSTFHEGDHFEGLRHSVNASQALGGMSVTYNGSLLGTK